MKFPTLTLPLSLFVLLSPLGLNAQSITIQKDQVIHADFAGLGFGWDGWSAPISSSMFRTGNTPAVSEQEFEAIYAKRWNELNPSVLRCQFGPGWYMPTANTLTWESTYMQSLYRILDLSKTTNTQVYFSDWAWNQYQPTWLTGGELDFSNLDYDLWAKVHVDGFHHLIVNKGYDHIKWWGNTNEMQDRSDDDKISFEEFKSVMVAFKAELASRNLEGMIGTLATDQSWYYKYTAYDSIEWAIENMDEYSDIYGGHRYANKESYNKVKATFDAGFSFANSKGKNFLVGEFGDQLYQRDAIDYGRRLSEIAIAGINAGSYAMCSWVFADGPYDYGSSYIDWGLFSDKNNGFAIKPAYYSYGLLTKYFRPNSTVYANSASLELDGLVSASAQDSNGNWTIALVNNNEVDREVSLNFSEPVSDLTLRKYIFDPLNVPSDDDGNLQQNSGFINIPSGGSGTITVPARGLVLLTDNPDPTGRDIPAGYSDGPLAFIPWNANGIIDTGTWFGWIHAVRYPWLYLYSTQSWAFINQNTSDQDGTWLYIRK